MHISKIPFSELPMLAKTDRAYSENDQLLRDFYKYAPKLKSFEQIIVDKKNDKTDRKTLVEVLRAQYKNLEKFTTVQNNIEALLSENTFTITTAHQPSLLLGPLYFVYKIFSVINLCEKLNKGMGYEVLGKEGNPILNTKYLTPTIVPVFVIGGEDHDFEEVNNINIFGKKLVWGKLDLPAQDLLKKENQPNISYSNAGAVGMMHTDSLKPVLEELKKMMNVDTDETAAELYTKIEKAYTSDILYQDATQDLLNVLFGKYGLVVLNMNDKTLKRLFVPVMEREIREQPSKKFVQDTQAQLETRGFKPQAFARDINLFYMGTLDNGQLTTDDRINLSVISKSNFRERIVEEDGIYKVLNIEKQWIGLSDILEELHAHPERFSPNVVLRPLYQETVLPNLAYVGGGGELAYWLERKTQFEYFGINFPMLVRRNSVLWLDKTTQEKLSRLKIDTGQLPVDKEQNNFQLKDLALHPDVLAKKYIAGNTTQMLSFEEEKKELAAIFDKITERAKSVDASLEKTVLAEKTKQLQAVEAIEARLVKAEKQRHETSLNQLRALQQKLFPNQGLQERTDNFIPLYMKHGDAFFEVLKDNLNPMEQGLMVIN